MTPSVPHGGTLLRLAPPRRVRILRSLLLCAFVCALPGCVTYDGTLKADGSGSFEMTYAMPQDGTPDAEKKRYTSDHVTVDSWQQNGKSATVKGHFDDVTRLSTAAAFKDVTVTRAQDGADERVTVKIVNPTPKTFKDTGTPGPKLTFHLPGTVRDASPNAKVSGDTVTFAFTLAEWAKDGSHELTVRYAAAAKDDAKKSDEAKPAAKEPAPTGKSKKKAH